MSGRTPILPRFGLLVVLSLVASGCSESVEQDLGEGDPVASVGVVWEGAQGGPGGAAGATGGDASQTPPLCFTEIIRNDRGLPECFVAEVGSNVDCSVSGRLELSTERREAALDQYCADPSVDAPCEGADACGLIRLEGREQLACSQQLSSEPGFCLLDESAPECAAAERDALRFVLGGTAPAFGVSRAYYAFCAVGPETEDRSSE